MTPRVPSGCNGLSVAYEARVIGMPFKVCEGTSSNHRRARLLQAGKLLIHVGNHGPPLCNEFPSVLT